MTHYTRALLPKPLMLTGAACLMMWFGCGVNGNNDTTTPAQDMTPGVTQDQGGAQPDMPAAPTDDGGDVTPDVPVDAPDAQPDMPDEADMPAEVDMPPEGPITYHSHIKPMLNQHCTRCHFDGGQGPSDFTVSSYVVENAAWIESRVSAGEMPPPVADPSCRDYLSSDALSISPENKQILKQWIDEGKVMGQDDGVPAAPPEASTFDDPDIELRLIAPYTPTYDDAENPNNEYRCFALEHGQDKRFYITGMHPIIDQSSIVHHVVLAKLNRSDLPADTTSMAGQDCIRNMGAIQSMVGAWAPGMDPIEFDKAGVEINSNEVLILQMHYYADSAENMNIPDQSGYALKIADDVKNKIQMFPFGDTGFNIPAGEAAHEESTSVSLPVPITLWGVFPHMHKIGVAYDMDVTIDNNSTCLLNGPKYDFNNQLTYIYKEPMVIPGGSEIKFNCRWNNSPSNPVLAGQPITDVGYGERTDEEMCYGFSYVSIGLPRN
jgi:hypothetical protein